MGDKTRIGFHRLHEEIRPLLCERRTVELPDGGTIAESTKEWCYKVTAIIVATFRLLEGVPTGRRTTHQKGLEALLQQHLGHPTVLFRYKLQRPSDDPGYLRAASSAYTDFLMAFNEYLWGLTQEFPNAEVPQPEGHPDREREYVAMRLGRGRSGLDSFVSEWRSEQGADLPFVVRKPGLPWLVDLAKFEEWRRSSEGAKATVKRKAGRPPKARI